MSETVGGEYSSKNKIDAPSTISNVAKKSIGADLGGGENKA
jgi:hypothetical protein